MPVDYFADLRRKPRPKKVKLNVTKFGESAVANFTSPLFLNMTVSSNSALTLGSDGQTKWRGA